MSLTELALQVVYNEERSRQKGNEGVVKALADLARFERSLHQDYFEDAGTGEEMINHRVRRFLFFLSNLGVLGYCFYIRKVISIPFDLNPRR
jgi:hypothetical protein